LSIPSKRIFTPEAKKKRREAGLRWAVRNRERLNTYQRKWNAEHPENVKAGKQKYYTSLPEGVKKQRARGYNLKSSYGMTVDDYDKMYKFQDGRCATCARFFEKLHVDHDHKTEDVRGLLCMNCNTALGCVQDDILVLRELIAYLEKSNG
jgi:hypothetical protein